MQKLYRQPQIVTRLDTTETLVKGLGLLAVPGLPEVVQKGQALISGGFTIGPSVGGKAALGPATQIPGYVGYDLPVPLAISDDFTWAFVASASQAAAGIDTQITESTGISNAFALGSASVGMTLDGNGSGTISGDFTRTTTFIGRRVGNQAMLFINGVLVSTWTTGQRTGVISGVTLGRNRLGNNNPNQTAVYLTAIASRAWTDREVALFAANPYRMFASPKRQALFAPSAAGGGTAALTGQAATASAGTLAPSTARLLTGQSATASAGTMITGDADAISGQASATSAGATSPSISIGLTGQSTTASAGAVSPSNTHALTGQSVTASAGTMSTSNDVTTALTGQAATMSVGTLSPSSAVGASGSASTATPGSMTATPMLGIIGQSAAMASGNVTPSTALPLAGNAATTAQGVLGVVGDVTVSLTGQAATVYQGLMARLAPPSQDGSGGWFELPNVRHARSVRAERERLGIFKRVEQIIEQVAVESVEDDATDRQATGLLTRALEAQSIAPAPRYTALLQTERDELIARDIRVALLLRAKRKADDDADERDAEMLLMM